MNINNKNLFYTKIKKWILIIIKFILYNNKK